MKYLALLSTCFVLATPAAHARPVSYAGGWTVMQMNDALDNSLHLHYTPDPDYSIGYKYLHDRDGDWNFHGAQVNNLLKRWNFDDAQANIYLKSGAGWAFDDQGDGAQGFTGLAADWENRRFFTQYTNNIIFSENERNNFQQVARVGVAPYIGDYGDLHTWLMLDLKHVPERDDKYIVTPMVRFFKGTYLFEAGMSTDGEALFNWVIRY